MLCSLAIWANKRWSNLRFLIIDGETGDIRWQELVEVAAFVAMAVGTAHGVDVYAVRGGDYVGRCVKDLQSRLDPYPSACFDIGLLYLTQLGFFSERSKANGRKTIKPYDL